MVDYYTKGIRNILLAMMLMIVPLVKLEAQSPVMAISKPEVFKKNKASCRRLGNIYDACHWMLRFTVKNNKKAELNKFCFKMEVNKKMYELCYGKKKLSIIQGKSRAFLVNLTEQMNVKVDNQTPFVRILVK